MGPHAQSNTETALSGAPAAHAETTDEVSVTLGAGISNLLTHMREAAQVAAQAPAAPPPDASFTGFAAAPPTAPVAGLHGRAASTNSNTNTTPNQNSAHTTNLPQQRQQDVGEGRLHPAIPEDVEVKDVLVLHTPAPQPVPLAASVAPPPPAPPRPAFGRPLPPAAQQPLPTGMQTAPALDVLTDTLLPDELYALSPTGPRSFCGLFGRSTKPAAAAQKRGAGVPPHPFARSGGWASMHEGAQVTTARALLCKAALLPLHRRHELLAAAAALPELAPLFEAPLAPAAVAGTGGGGGGGASRPFREVANLEAKLTALYDRVLAAPPQQPKEQQQQQQPEQPGAAQAEAQAGGGAQAHEALALRVVPEYDAYGMAADETVRAVVSIKAAAEVRQRARVALTCVLDRSGSMSGSRMDLVRDTAHFLVDALTPDDYLAFVSYSGDVRVDVPLLQMTAHARALAHCLVDALCADGSTALYEGLAAGVRQQMEAERALAAAGDGTRVVHTCFLFTDGHATDGPSTPEAIAVELQQLQAPTDQHVTVHTFGYGEGHSVELLRSIAGAQSGVYYYVAGVDDIAAGFGDALGGLLATTAKNVRLAVRAAPDATLTAFRSGGRVLGGSGAAAANGGGGGGQAALRATLPPAARRQSRGAAGSGRAAPAAAEAAVAAAIPTAVSFNDMFAEESREMLLVLRLPAAGGAPAAADAGAAAAAVTVTALEVDLEYVDAASGRVVQLTAVLRVRRCCPPPPPGSQLPNELVFTTAARFETLDAIEAAARAAEADGDADACVATAQEMLDAHAARLAAAPLQSALLETLAAQTATARASVKPRYQFNNQEGIAAIANSCQTLRNQRTANTASSAGPAMYDHAFKSACRASATASVNLAQQRKYSQQR